MLPHRTLLAAILVASLLAGGCVPSAFEDVGDLRVLQNELTTKFGDQIHVHLAIGVNRGTLYVHFINSALNDRPSQERASRALEAAQFVKARFRQMNEVTGISVLFLRRKTRFLILHSTHTLDGYSFDREAQLVQLPGTTTNPSVPLETTANYDSRRNESNVFAYGIQLDGEPGKDGVTVLPNFKTAGDVNVKKGRPPKTVQFDFASYSGTPRFEQTVPVTFVVDGKTLLQIEGTFHGNDAQFCYLPVPYPAFRKIIAANELVIKLGDKVYPLTPSQLDVIRKMSEYVTE